eukprot:3352662-Prymnesium_polylepis.1
MNTALGREGDACGRGAGWPRGTSATSSTKSALSHGAATFSHGTLSNADDAPRPSAERIRLSE